MWVGILEIMQPHVALVRICLILTTAGMAGACASDQASRYFLSEKLAPRSVEQVVLLNAAPARRYEIIAEFQARGSSPETMRKKAAEVGADAVIVVLAGGYRATSSEWASDATYSSYYTRIIGTAIRYFKE